MPTKSIRIKCRQCKCATNHSVLYEDSTSWESDDESESGLIESKLVKCNGCDSVALYERSWNSEEPGQESENLPDPESTRAPIEGYYRLPTRVRAIYTETLHALSAKEPVLTGIGVRAIIETVCKDQNAQGRDLKKKIDNLVTQGMLTKGGASLLHKLRILGNKAAHEVKPHTARELALALDVVDHLLLGVYILPKDAAATFQP